MDEDKGGDNQERIFKVPYKFDMPETYDDNLSTYKNELNPINRTGYLKSNDLHAYYILDWETRKYSYISEDWYVLSGIDVSRLYQQGMNYTYQLIHPDDKEAVFKMTNKALEFLHGKSEEEINQYSISFNFRINKPPNDFIMLLQQLLFVSLDRKKNIVYELGMITDVSNWAKYEELCLRIYGPGQELIIEFYPKSSEKQCYNLPDAFLRIMKNEKIQSNNQFFKKFQAEVNKNITNDKFSIEQLSEQMNLSRAQLYRKVNAVLKTTPSEYVRIVRLTRALKLLQNTSLNITEITYDCGFSNVSYFIHVFRKEFGKTPNQIRKHR